MAGADLAIMQEAVVPSKRHKRSQTMLDGSQAQQPPQQPTTQPNTPVKRSLWGSRAAPAPEEPAGPSPYADCDPFDVIMMRCCLTSQAVAPRIRPNIATVISYLQPSVLTPPILLCCTSVLLLRQTMCPSKSLSGSGHSTTKMCPSPMCWLPRLLDA